MDKRKTNRSHPCAAAGTPLTPTAPPPARHREVGGEGAALPPHLVLGVSQVRRVSVGQDWPPAQGMQLQQRPGWEGQSFGGAGGDPKGLCPSPAFGDSQSQGGQMWGGGGEEGGVPGCPLCSEERHLPHPQGATASTVPPPTPRCPHSKNEPGTRINKLYSGACPPRPPPFPPSPCRQDWAPPSPRARSRGWHRHAPPTAPTPPGGAGAGPVQRPPTLKPLKSQQQQKKKFNNNKSCDTPPPPPHPHPTPAAPTVPPPPAQA